ncbi:MAG: MerR family transcriptional regulator [Euryarchaeota archaeon]|nr:MerR family transcriptional regulator [Euryarchaeota archaeon]
MNESDRFIGIGTFSMIARLTRRALRLYDEKGLLTPARREITGYRQYSYQQIRRDIQLKRLSDLGFGIRDVKEIVDAPDGFAGAAWLDTILEKRLKEVGVEICRLEKIRGSLLTKEFSGGDILGQERTNAKGYVRSAFFLVCDRQCRLPRRCDPSRLLCDYSCSNDLADTLHLSSMLLSSTIARGSSQSY